MKHDSAWVFTQEENWRKECAKLAAKGSPMPEARLEAMEKRFEEYRANAHRFERGVPGQAAVDINSLAIAVAAAMQAVKDEKNETAPLVSPAPPALPKSGKASSATK